MPYLTPDEIPEDDDCRPLSIPASSDWLAIVSGALTELTKPYNWQAFGAVTVDEAVERMQAMVDAYYADPCGQCVTPEDTPVFRVNLDGEIEQLDNGSWIAPSGEWALPTLTERSEPTEEERICMASRNAAAVLAGMYEAVSDQYNTEVDPYLGMAALAIAAGIALAFPFAPIVGAILLFIEVPFAVFYFTIEALSADLWDEAFTDKLVCLLQSVAVADGDFVLFDFEALITRLGEGTNLFDPTATELRLFFQVDFLLRTIGSDGLNLAGATTGVAEGDCLVCEPTWCYMWDFTVDAGNWTIYPGQPGSLTASGYETGLTFVSGDPTRGREQTIIEFLGFDNTVEITGINVFVNSTLGNVSAAGLANGIYKNNFATALTTGAPFNGIADVSYSDPTDIYPASSFQVIIVAGGCDGCGDPGGNAIITGIQMTGRGDLPTEFEGGEDCS